MRFTPTPSQNDVLEADDSLLVVGRPGTGKTTIALEKARRFVLESELEGHHKVLFLSFSNAAVSRIREAARTELNREMRRRLQTTTFHAFCYHFLSAHRRFAGLKKPFSLLPSEREDILKSKLGDTPFKAELKRLEAEEGQVIFDRFAPLVVKVLKRIGTLRDAYSGSFPLVIADEYQDTDDAQHKMVSLLSSPGQLICLGDPEQRIYDFRDGIRPDRLERAQEELGLRRVELEGNHRSKDSDVLSLARAVLQGSSEIPRPDSVTYWRYRTDSQLNDAIKNAIVYLEREIRKEKEGSEESVSIAIMAYSNRFVGRLSALLNTPTEKHEHPFGHRVSISPKKVSIAWDAALSVLEPRMSVRAKTRYVLEAAANLNRVEGGDSKVEKARKLEEWAGRLEEGELSRRARGVWELQDRIGEVVLNFTGDPGVDIREVREAFRDIPGKHLKRIVRVLDLRPITAPFSLTDTLARTYRDTGSYLTARRAGSEYLLQERMEVRGRDTAGRVLMTMHKCKGKEFDAVLLVDGRYGRSLVTWEEREAEEKPYTRRLVHVALSRARHAAVVFIPAGNRSPVLPKLVEDENEAE